MKKRSEKYYQLLENIQAIRKEKGLSQENVGFAIGKKQPGYALIENGNRGLDYQMLLQIAIELDVSVVDIITYPEKLVSHEISEVNEPITVYGKCAICAEKEKRILLLEKYIERLELDLGKNRKIV